jgi:hypothetical protein
MSDEADWKESLPEAFRDAPYFKSATSAENALSELNNAAQWQGNSLRMPGPDAGADDIAAFRGKVVEKVDGLMPVPDMEDADSVSAIFGKLGKPAEPSGYTLPELPEGIAVEGDMLSNLKTAAHEMNLTQAQFSAQVSQMTGAQVTATAAQGEAIEATKQALMTDWGNAFESRMAEIATFLANDADTPPNIVADLEAGRIPADQMKWLHKLTQLGDEASPVQGQQNATGELAPAEAEEQLNEVERRLLSGNNGRPMHASDPAYPGLVAKRDKLMLQAFPNLQAELAQWSSNG